MKEKKRIILNFKLYVFEDYFGIVTVINIDYMEEEDEFQFQAISQESILSRVIQADLIFLSLSIHFLLFSYILDAQKCFVLTIFIFKKKTPKIFHFIFKIIKYFREVVIFYKLGFKVYFSKLINFII